MEHSALGYFMRDSSLWTYPIINLIHILGIASLFGATLIIDLRLLGVWRRVPMPPVMDAAVPVAKAGFALAATTGAGLLALVANRPAPVVAASANPAFATGTAASITGGIGTRRQTPSKRKSIISVAPNSDAMPRIWI